VPTPVSEGAKRTVHKSSRRCSNALFDLLLYKLYHSHFPILVFGASSVTVTDFDISAIPPRSPDDCQEYHLRILGCQLNTQPRPTGSPLDLHGYAPAVPSHGNSKGVLDLHACESNNEVISTEKHTNNITEPSKSMRGHDF
jgi:hypothetical protein